MLGIFKRKKSEAEEQLKEILQGYELPSFPTLIMNILSLLRDPDSDMDEISELIGLDPGLHIRVLRMVNSASFGFSQKISNINHAVMLLGKARLEPVVLALAVRDSIPAPKTRSFDIEEFWRISARRASFARFMAHQLHPSTETESFTAGLLQDMAIPVLVEVKQDIYCRLWQQYLESRTISLSEIEKETFGYDHQKVGALMAAQWELPEYIVKSVEGHHNSSDTEPAVYLASFMKEYDSPEENELIFRVGESEFGINREEMLQYIQTAFNDARDLISLLK